MIAAKESPSPQIDAAPPPPHRTRRRTGLPVSAVVLAGVLLLAASVLLSDHMRTRGMLAVEAAVPLRVRQMEELSQRSPRLVTVHIPNSAEGLADYFSRLDYRLAEVRTGGDVPRVYVSELPKDLDGVQPIPRRKALFLRSVLPLVLRENEGLRRDRERLLGLRDALRSGAELDAADRTWLDTKYERYAVEPGRIERLLRRVDVVPASLALAQAAIESGWGTSRFVKEGNALFGMWTWKESVPGIVPEDRAEDENHRIRAFPTLAGSVHAYFRTLNTHWAYEDFRRAREKLRRRGKSLDGLALVPSISMYSEQRRLYTANLRSLIRGNDLHRLDGAVLVGAANIAATASRSTTAALLGGSVLIVQDSGR